MSRRKLLAGNWKMNGLRGAVSEAKAVAAGAAQAAPAADVLICPPFTLVHPVVEACAGSKVAVGGQNCHADASGACTGEVSAEMLADLGATWVIVGHSERRAMGESDADVRAKAKAGLRAKLNVIVCVGESLEERDAGQAAARVRSQVRASLPQTGAGPEVVVAYEPIWAIGTGRTASLADIAEMHDAIRAEIAAVQGAGTAEKTRILYGGSVKPSNSGEILRVDGVDGALVGGASLKAADFLEILKSSPTP
jgi:triosephosphate isomerase